MYPFVTVQVTYKGNPLSKKYFEEHPEIQHFYPSHAIFLHTLYLPLLQEAQETNTMQLLEISETAIKINGVEHKLP